MNGIPEEHFPQPPDVYCHQLISDDEIISIMRNGLNCRYNDEADHIDFARAIEAHSQNRWQIISSDLEQAAQKALKLLGPEAPECCGCRYEWEQAIEVLRNAIESVRWPKPLTSKGPGE